MSNNHFYFLFFSIFLVLTALYFEVEQKEFNVRISCDNFNWGYE